jgi:hypothetical protein
MMKPSDARDRKWNFFSFLYSLAIPVIGCLLCYLVVSALEADAVGLKASYHKNRVPDAARAWGVRPDFPEELANFTPARVARQPAHDKRRRAARRRAPISPQDPRSPGILAGR